MRQFLTVVALTILYALSPARADDSIQLKSGDFTIQVDVSEQANLIYHVDCITRVESCTSDAFEQLWRNELGLDADDRARLDEWKSIRNDLRESGGSDRMLPVQAQVPVYGADDDLAWTKIRSVEFVSADAAALKRGWSSLMPATSVDRLIAVVDHFRPKFHGWWKQHESEAVRFLPDIEAAMRKARAAELLRAAARLYRSDLGDGRVFVHLYLLPKAKWPSSRAGLVGAHLDVEVDPAEKVEDRAPIIVHELAHRLFARMPPERKAWLAETFLQSGRAGVVAWNLFDEVQATTIGNILAGRNVQPPELFEKTVKMTRGFYADDAIDLGARATEKIFDKALKKGGAMRSTFPKEIASAVKEGLGELLDTPPLQLRSMALNVQDDNAPWQRKLRKAVRPSAIWDNSPLGSAKFAERLGRFSGLSAVVIASPDQLSLLRSISGGLGVEPDALSAALGASNGIVFIAQRTPLAYSFVFVSRDPKVVDALIAAFGSCRLKPGVCVRIE